MKIIGVDPGTNILGYALIEVTGDAIKILSVGSIKLSAHKEHHVKLKEIYLQLQEIIETYLPQTMAIEAPFYGKNVQAMLKLGRAQGVAMAAAITMGLEIAEYSPKKVKQSVTGNGNAAKEQVAAMLEHLTSYPVHKDGLDASDALAVAYCHFLKLNGRDFTSGKSHGSWKSFVRDNPERID